MTIQTRPFGETGHNSSAIIFGAAALKNVDQSTADRTLDLLFQYGVNHIDTAPRYGDAEIRIGPWMEKHRKDFTTFSNLDHGFTGGHQGVPVFLSGVRPVLAHNYPELNISLDQKLAEYHGAATRLPSMTLGVRERNLLSFTRTGVQVPFGL